MLFRASELPRISEDPDFPGTLLGSWTTLYGPLDSAGGWMILTF